MRGPNCGRVRLHLVLEFAHVIPERGRERETLISHYEPLDLVIVCINYNLLEGH